MVNGLFSLIDDVLDKSLAVEGFFPEQLGGKGIQPLSYKALGLTVEILAAIHLKEWLFTLVIRQASSYARPHRQFNKAL